jgi:hypothetical protein
VSLERARLVKRESPKLEIWKSHSAPTSICSRLDVYEKMLSLRNEKTPDGKINYELIEVPIGALRRILDIPKATYKAEMAGSQSRTIPKSFNVKIPWCDKSGARDIVVKFDGGGERKLTITLPKECGKVVAAWSFASEI